MLEQKITTKKIYAWNTLGILCNASTSFILLIFVTHICGKTEAGIFAFGFAVAQLTLTIGKFGMRTYQATDINHNTKFASYLTSRIITCLLMLVISTIYILLSDFDFYKSIIIFFLCIIKMVDAMEDVYHGHFQQHLRIDLAGKLLTYRNLVTIISFVVIILISKSILITTILVGIISVVAFLALNIPLASKNFKVHYTFSKNDLSKLFISCLPLFIGTFLSMFINNMPKYSIDKHLTLDMQTYFSILFMPAFVINLISEFIFKPLLTSFSFMWNDNKLKDLIRLILTLLFMIVVITIITVGFGYYIGIDLLSLLYGVDLSQYSLSFIIILLGGGLNAAVFLFYNLLTTLRKQIYILWGYLVVTVIVLFICPYMVKKYDIMGASFSYLLSNVLLLIYFSIMLIVAIIRKGKRLRKRSSYENTSYNPSLQ